MITWVSVERILDGAPTSVGAMSGAVAGLVNITPCAGFVEPLGALGVGAIGAICCVFAARGLKKLNLVAYGKNENSGKPNAFGEHSQR
eukprot:s13007_g1.t1